jgi:hypothetical protein
VHRGGGDAHLSGLQGGHVENVVEQRQQVAGRGPGGRHIVFLLRVQRGVVKQAEHAEHAVERRAQLVAHVGQELALAAVGLFGLQIGFAQVTGQGFELPAFFFLAPLAHRERQGRDQQQDQLRQGQPDDFARSGPASC